jgi:hypothetical protein
MLATVASLVATTLAQCLLYQTFIPVLPQILNCRKNCEVSCEISALFLSKLVGNPKHDFELRGPSTALEHLPAPAVPFSSATKEEKIL